MGIIKCVTSPIELGEKIARSLRNPEVLAGYDSALAYVSSELLKSQDELAELSKTQLSERQDVMESKEFIKAFEDTLVEIIEEDIIDLASEEHAIVLQELIDSDISKDAIVSFENYLESDKKFSTLNNSELAVDETIEDMVAKYVEQADDLVMDNYGKYLLNLANRYLGTSNIPSFSAVSGADLANDLSDFISSMMYLSLLDTRADGIDIGFNKDPEVLKQKMLSNAEDVITNNKNLSSKDLFDSFDNEASIRARNLLFANIIKDNIDPLSDHIFDFEGFNMKENFDGKKLSSDAFLDKLSLLIVNNSPRLVEVAPGEFKIDPLNPIITPKEMKNTVFAALSNINGNNLSEIRKALGSSNNPIIKSIYTYYFSDSETGYMLSVNGMLAQKHYSYAHAITSAKVEAYGKDRVDEDKRKYTGFDSKDSDLFKNRIVTTFISTAKSDRVKLSNGKLKFASDAKAATDMAYTNTLETAIEEDKNIPSNIHIDKVDKDTVVVTITKDRPAENGGGKQKLVSFNFDMSRRKGRLGIISSSISIPENRNFNENKLITDALEVLGFEWADRNFIQEYNRIIVGESKSSSHSLNNFTANLAMAAVLNNEELFKRLQSFNKDAVYPPTPLDGDEVSTGLKFKLRDTLSDFLGTGGVITVAMEAAFPYGAMVKYTSQEGEMVASTTAANLNSKKGRTINNAQKLLLSKDKFTTLEGNILVGTKDKGGNLINPVARITKRAIKEGVEEGGNSSYLDKMDAYDRTIALAKMSMASFEKSKGKSFIVQPHLYADKNTIEVFQLDFDEALIPNLEHEGKKKFLVSKVIDNYQRKYKNLGRSIYTQWSKVLLDPLTEHFMEVPDGIDIRKVLDSTEYDLEKLNTLLSAIKIDPEFVAKSPFLSEGQAFTVNKKGVVGIKQTTLGYQKIFNNRTKAVKLIKHYNKQMVDAVVYKEGDASTADIKDLEIFNLLHMQLAPQVEELSMGDSSQFKGDASIEIDFSRVTNTFDSERDYQDFLNIMYLEQGANSQYVDKTKRAGNLITGGVYLSLLADGEVGFGLGEEFNSVTIADTEETIKLITENVKGIESRDGNRISFELVRLQTNASLGENGLSSKGEAHKDGLITYDEETGTYRSQKMSTMFMTPQYLANSPEGVKMLKRMLTHITFPSGTEVMLAGSRINDTVNVFNMWDVLMHISRQDSLSITDPAIWYILQKTEAYNPHIRGQYLSYVTLKTVEKVGSTGIETSSAITENIEYSKGDKIQWSSAGEGNHYTTGTVKSVSSKTKVAKRIELAEELKVKESELLKATVLGKTMLRAPRTQAKSLVAVEAEETTGFSYDGIEIDTDFILGKEQKEALKSLIQFVLNEGNAASESNITLQGSAGTGKTTIIGYLEAYLEKAGKTDQLKTLYLAPTHAATVQLAESTAKTGNEDFPSTVPSAVYSYIKNGEEKVNFSNKIKAILERKTPIVVVDEASMLSKKEIDLLSKVANSAGGKVIMLGDPAQIPKVIKSKEALLSKPVSSAFTDYRQLKLTKVYRQKKGPLLNILNYIKNASGIKARKQKAVNKGLAPNQYLDSLFIPFKPIENYESLQFIDDEAYNKQLAEDAINKGEDTVIISYNKKSVARNNAGIKKLKNNGTEPSIGDAILGYIGYANKQITDGNVANSVKYTVSKISDNPDGSKKITVTSKALDKLSKSFTSIDKEATSNYYQLSAQDSLNFNYDSPAEAFAKNNAAVSKIFKPLGDAYLKAKAKLGSEFYKDEAYKARIESLKVKSDLKEIDLGDDYVYNPSTGSMELLTFNNGSLPTAFKIEKGIDYGWSTTIHKVQGLTVENVYFDAKSLNTMPQDIEIVDGNGNILTTERNALYYVALSRASKKVVVNTTGMVFEEFDAKDVDPVDISFLVKKDNISSKSKSNLGKDLANIGNSIEVYYEGPDTAKAVESVSMFDKTDKELKAGSVVTYVGKTYIAWKIKDDNKVQLIGADGSKFSGTPDLKHLKPTGSYKATSYNGTEYIVTDKGSIYSLSTGKLSFTGSSSTSVNAKNKIYSDVGYEGGRITKFRNAEHAYQTWKSGEYDSKAANSSVELIESAGGTNKGIMKDIIISKLKRNPELIDKINAAGGLAYILGSTHIEKGKNSFWESLDPKRKKTSEDLDIEDLRVDERGLNEEIAKLEALLYMNNSLSDEENIVFSPEVLIYTWLSKGNILDRNISKYIGKKAKIGNDGDARNHWYVKEGEKGLSLEGAAHKIWEEYNTELLGDGILNDTLQIANIITELVGLSKAEASEFYEGNKKGIQLRVNIKGVKDELKEVEANIEAKEYKGNRFIETLAEAYKEVSPESYEASKVVMESRAAHEAANPTQYTSYKVLDSKKLKEKYPSNLPNKFYHHSTVKFGQQAFDPREGEQKTIDIIGRITTDTVDVLLVKGFKGSNEYNHITLATAEGIPPMASNQVIADYMATTNGKILTENALNDSVNTEFTNTLRKGAVLTTSPVEAVFGVSVDKEQTFAELKKLSNNGKVVYTKEGVYTMRPTNFKTNKEHFGNIFTGSGLKNLIAVTDSEGNVGTKEAVEKASKLYKEWLLSDIDTLEYEGESFDTSEYKEQKAWIRKEIEEGVLENQILLYSNKTIKNDLYYSHADALSEVISDLTVRPDVHIPAEIEAIKKQIKEIDNYVPGGTMLQVIRNTNEVVGAEEYPNNEVVTMVVANNGNAQIIDPETREPLEYLESTQRAVSSSKLKYKDLTIILKAGKDFDDKSGVAKMTQAVTSVLFNDSYINDAINMMTAQGSMAASNIKRLKEGFVDLAYEAVLKADSIHGVSDFELETIKDLLSKQYVSKVAYTKNKVLIDEFFSRSAVIRLGYKSFIAKSVREDSIDPELAKQIKEVDYSFSGSTTELMAKAFSTAIERATVKARYTGANLILSQAEEGFMPYDYKGTRMLRQDLIEHLMQDERNMVSLTHKYVKNPKTKMVTREQLNVLEAEELFFSLNLNDHDIIVIPKGEGKGLRYLSVLEFTDTFIKQDFEDITNTDTIPLKEKQNYSLRKLFDTLKVDPKIRIITLNQYKQSKLQGPKIVDPRGKEITDTIAHESYMFFKDGVDTQAVLSEDVFGIYKGLSATTNRAEYDFFNTFSTYEEYVNYMQIKGKEVVFNSMLFTQETINGFLWELDKNLIKVGNEFKLHNPISLPVFGFEGIEDIETLQQEIIKKSGGQKNLDLTQLVEYLEGTELSLNDVFKIVKVDTPAESAVHSTEQENAMLSIEMLGEANAKYDIKEPSPIATAQANLLTELRSVEGADAKYKTIDSEVIIPFMSSAEFGFDKKAPSLIEILGIHTTEEEALVNAKKYFNRKGNINFLRFSDKEAQKLTNDTGGEQALRSIIKYKQKLEEELVLINTLATGVDSKKGSLIKEVLDILEPLILEGESSAVVNALSLPVKINKKVNNSGYGKYVKENRAEAFVKYIKIFYGRIPGTGLQTNGTGKIVGFIQDMGNTAFLSIFNSIITGSDFDIDKITSLYHAVDSNGISYGYDKWLESGDQINTISDELQKDLTLVNSVNLQEMASTVTNESFEKELAIKSEEYREGIFKLNKGKENVNKISIVGLEKKVQKFKKSYRDQYEKGIQNYILDQLRNITKGVDVQFEAQTRVSTDSIATAKSKLLNRKFDKPQTRAQKLYSNTTLYSNEFNLTSQMGAESQNKVGNKSVGMYANAQKMIGAVKLSINVDKKKGIEDSHAFKEEALIALDRNGKEVLLRKRHFSNTLDLTKKSGNSDIILRKVIADIRVTNPDANISDIIALVGQDETLNEKYGIDILSSWRAKILELNSIQGWESIGQFIQSSVDNAKKLELGVIGANEETNSYFAFSIMAGFNIGDTIEFLSNPKIKAISLLLQNFNKDITTPFNLGSIFGDSKDIPKEFISVFGGEVVNTWPSDVSMDAASLTKKLAARVPEGGSGLTYASFLSIIKGAEELQVLATMIGLDVRTPNGMEDTIAKRITIGLAFQKVIGKDTIKEHSWMKSPSQLVTGYLTNQDKREHINRIFENNTSYINALHVMENHPSFKEYLNNLGLHAELTGALSYLPNIIDGVKFRGHKKASYTELKNATLVGYKYGVTNYIHNVSDYAKHVKLSTTDKTYDLRNGADLKDFLQDFRGDFKALRKKYKSLLFKLIKEDSDFNYIKGAPRDEKFLSLMLSSSSKPNEIVFLSNSIRSLNDENATVEQKLFYKNLKLYSLITEGGLAPKNGFFTHLRTDMPDFNNSLEDLNMNPKATRDLVDIDPITVSLHAQHLLKEVDTALKDTSKMSHEEQQDHMNELREEVQAKLEEERNAEENGYRLERFPNKEIYLDQKEEIYKSKHTGTVYYKPLSLLGHIIISPKASLKSTLIDYTKADPIESAGFSYGLPMKLKGEDIYILKYDSKADVRTNQYLYLTSQQMLDFPNSLRAYRQAKNSNLSPENLKAFTSEFEKNIKKVSDAELAFNNPSWVFKGNEIRQKRPAEENYRYFKATKSYNVLPIPEKPIDLNIEFQGDEYTAIEVGTKASDYKNFKLSNRAIIKGNMDKIGYYRERLTKLYTDSILSNSNFKSTDVVTVIVDKPTDGFKAAVNAGATIILNNLSPQSLTDIVISKGYVRLKNDVWMKPSVIKAQKSTIPVPHSYRAKAKRINNRVFNNVLAKLKGMFPNIKVEVLSSFEIKNDPNLGVALSANKGFVYEGVLYLNSDLMTLDTPLHEYGHIYMADLKFTDPNLYLNITSKALEHPLAEEVRARYPELSNTDLGEEIFVEALGKEAASNVPDTVLGRWFGDAKQWLMDAFAKIFNTNKSKVTVNDSLNTIINKVGQKLVFKSDLMVNLDSNDHSDWLTGTKESISYTVIENNLIEQGFIKKLCSFDI